MLSDIHALKHQAWKVIEFAAQVGTFLLSEHLWSLLTTAWGITLGLVGEVIAMVISLALGALLPSLFLARPIVTVRWRVDDIEAAGHHQVDLRRRDRREFTFRVDLFLRARSLAGWCVLRALLRAEPVAVVSFVPLDSARLKRQTVAGGAALRGRQQIVLPLNDPHPEEDPQASFFGSMVTRVAGSDVTIGTRATLESGRFRTMRKFVQVNSEVSKLRIVG